MPSGIVDSLWFELEDQFEEWGDSFDTWQDGLGQCILGLRSDGTFAATVGGITISIPRQVAKTFIVGRIVFAICAKFPKTTVVWTAHRTRTATQTFEKLKAFAQRPTVRPCLAKGRNNGLRDSHGEQEIRFANGSVIMFGAREQGFGRGFDEVDIEVFDEAQILTEKALEDMVAATNQSRFPHGALLFYMGTPPRPVDPGAVFSLRRDKALEMAALRDQDPTVEFDALYVECSADPEVARKNPDDRVQWAIANPSYPHRTPLISMLRLRENLPSDDSWLREALGVWDEVHRSITPAFDVKKWKALAIGAAPDGGKPVYGVKFSADGLTVAMAGGVRVGEVVHLEGLEHRLTADGTRWIVEFLSARAKTAASIVVDGKAGTGALVKALVHAGVPQRKIVVPTVEQAITAHSMMATAITEATVSHIGDPLFQTAVENAPRRAIGKAGGWGIQGANGIDVTLLEAALLAHFGAEMKRRPTGERRGREAVVL